MSENSCVLRTNPIENPYDSPLVLGSLPASDPVPLPRFPRGIVSLCIALVEIPIGAILCSVGYLAVIFILESAFVPPLHSPHNYGQFGFLLLVFGFFGTIYGASLAMIPYTRFLLWLPAFLLISFFAISGDVAFHFDASEVTCTAMMVIGVVIVLLALLTSVIVHRLERKHLPTGDVSFPNG